MKEEKDNIENLLSRYLSKEASSEEIVQLMNWKDSSPENLALFENYAKIWAQLKNTSKNQKVDINFEWELHKSKYLGKKAKTRTLTPVLKWVAGVLLIIGFSFTAWLYFSTKAIKTNELVSSEVVLPDGSIVTLNVFSKINYSRNFGKKNRIVELQGEAFFKVKKNSKLPFIIHAGKAEIKVLGTSFNVKAYKNSKQVEVVVAEGTVKVYPKNKPLNSAIIITGQKAIYNEKTDNIQNFENDNLNFISWKTKSLVFDNNNLDYVVKTLSEVYQVEMVIENKEILNCTLTTTFDNADLSTVLKVLKSTFNIKVRVSGEKIIISGKSC